MKAPNMAETYFNTLFVKGRNDDEKLKDSNNDDVFTSCLPEKISNTKIIKLLCVFFWYGMAVRTQLKYIMLYSMK